MMGNKVMNESSPRSQDILGMRVDSLTYEEITGRVLEMIGKGQRGTICVANVHMVMEAYDDPAFRGMVNGADLVTADGMPLVWVQRLLGDRKARRVYGPQLMENLLAAAAKNSIPVGLLGGKPDVLDRLLKKIQKKYPNLAIVYSFSPPFWQSTRQEVESIISGINEAGVRLLFIGLGCPKQEIWMAENGEKIGAVAVGVGAAFDFLSGGKPQAPVWMRRSGLEWLFRLLHEPRRLWWRYFYNNPRFIRHVSKQLLQGRKKC
jgi:N-acetylglucosaminyldiphosphoundecaprenol N-acetyl-beta-D-mannosaminyltransferase